MLPRPKIAVLCPRAPGDGFGGAEKHLADLSKVIKDIGADVIFYSHAHAPPIKNPITTIFVRAFPLAASPLAVRRMVRAHPAIISDADIVLSIELMGYGVKHPRHLHLFFGSYSCFRRDALAPRRGIPRIATGLLNLISDHLERGTQGPLGAIANSGRLRDRLRAQSIPVRDEVLLPPTDTSHFSAGDKDGARKQLGLPGSTLLLFAGRWEYAKGADRICVLLRHMPKEWRVVLTVPTPLNWALPDDPRIIIRENINHEEMATYYRAADLLLQPSRFEGYSLVASEAQSSGCPVLSSNVGQAHHYLQSEDKCIRNCVILEADTPSAWICKANEVLSDLCMYSASARRYAEQFVSYSATSEAWRCFLVKNFPEFTWTPR